MKLFKRTPNLSYISDMHLLIDDLKELTELRDDAPNTEEELFYTRLINGAQRVLEFMQEETHGRNA